MCDIPRKAKCDTILKKKLNVKRNWMKHFFCDIPRKAKYDTIKKILDVDYRIDSLKEI